MNAVTKEYNDDLTVLCDNVRALSGEGDYEKCRELICLSMKNFPDAPQPHNLLGIILEKTGEHALAMKHFRAAWALDPTYHPANQNLITFGSFSSDGKCAYDNSDCREEKGNKVKNVIHVGNGIKTEYDRYGIGHLVKE